jgi:hypothetical protein
LFALHFLLTWGVQRVLLLSAPIALVLGGESHSKQH